MICVKLTISTTALVDNLWAEASAQQWKYLD